MVVISLISQIEATRRNNEQAYLNPIEIEVLWIEKNHDTLRLYQLKNEVLNWMKSNSFANISTHEYREWFYVLGNIHQILPDKKMVFLIDGTVLTYQCLIITCGYQRSPPNPLLLLILKKVLLMTEDNIKFSSVNPGTFSFSTQKRKFDISVETTPKTHQKAMQEKIHQLLDSHSHTPLKRFYYIQF